jgi:hypothetical protein
VERTLIKFRATGGPGGRDVVDRVGYATEVGETGMVLVSKRPFPATTRLELKLPDRTVRGEVKAVGDPDDAGDYRIEVTLAEPEPEAEGLSLMSDEKRRFPRKECRHFLRYRCISKGMHFEVEPRSGVVTDISKGGVRLKAVRQYEPGSILELEMPEGVAGPSFAPDGGATEGRPKKMKLYAKVAWRGPTEKPGEFFHGCVFVKVAGEVPLGGL